MFVTADTKLPHKPIQTIFGSMRPIRQTGLPRIQKNTTASSTSARKTAPPKGSSSISGNASPGYMPTCVIVNLFTSRKKLETK